MPLFDLSHILCTPTFIDFFWNNHHFQKLEEKLRSACFRWGIILKPAVTTEVWCAYPDSLADFFCPVFNSRRLIVTSYNSKGLSCGFPSEPLEEGMQQDPDRSPEPAGRSDKALTQPHQLPLALLEEQPVQSCHLTVPQAALELLYNLTWWAVYTVSRNPPEIKRRRLR